MLKRTSCILIVMLVAAIVLLPACSPTPTPTMPPPTEAPTEAPPTPTEAPAAKEFEGQAVSVIAVWGGDELESFRAMVAPWEERTGATVEYEGTRDLNAVLTTRVEGGNPPDIAGLPGPAVLQQFAEDGHLVDLSTFMDADKLAEEYDQSWLDLASYEGGLYGIFTKAAVKSMVWYSPPACYMHRQASFIQGFITDQYPDLEPVKDYNYFAFPPIDPAYGTPALSAGDLFGMFNDTPAARSLLEWLASAEAQEIWAKRGGFLSPNKKVSPEVYPDPLIAQAAEILVSAEVVRFDASDLMPAAVNEAFWAGTLEYIQNPGDLDDILQRIEDTAVEAYQ